ncbi:hypothetical protein BPNPMPFG_007855 (plasmid) [Mesorhizobium sp. AR07]|uniref:hypothetical protein n=1 Tax=Mesorhizobium sp. AR07 TaxID=2865838 RepID=UPI002160E237|nr:hypothetical protein [Mesorhizobium sp. AR07]UVK48476.1 hypothetical protein BPNPMPFG_007855 [Mesorhizobium sp. AR07]
MAFAILMLRKYGTPRVAVPAVLELRDCPFTYENARRLFQRTGRNIASYINPLVAQLTTGLRPAEQGSAACGRGLSPGRNHKNQTARAQLDTVEPTPAHPAPDQGTSAPPPPSGF